MSQKVNVFVIYAAEDKDTMLHLLRHMKPFEVDFNASFYCDDPVYSGQQWKPQNESHLNEAQVFFLLVSTDLLHSEFIKQIEFKNIIDKYKSNKATVIPIIIDHCQWDVDFKSEDYNFNLNELRVFPEQGKPIVAWESMDQVCHHVEIGVKGILQTLTGNSPQEELKKEVEEKTTKDQHVEQVAISFDEESEIIAAQRRVAEAAALKKVEDEENRLAADEAKSRAEEEQRLEKLAETKRRTEEVRSHTIATEAKRKAEEERKLTEENQKRITAEETERRAAKEKTLKEKQYQQADKEVHQEFKKEKDGDPIKHKKRRIVGFSVAALAIIGIWVFSVFKSNQERPATPSQTTNESEIVDSVALGKTNIDDSGKDEINSLKKEVSFSKLRVGDTYGSGIVFEIDGIGDTGKIVHLEDSDAIPWISAMKIDEQLGEGWRLPTLEELELLYKTVGQGATNKAQFSDGLYWSATLYDENQARLLKFRDGNTSYHYNKHSPQRKFLVRAVQDFSR